MQIVISIFSIIGQVLLWLLFVLFVLSIIQWKVNIGYFDKKLYFALYLDNWKVFSFHKPMKPREDEEKEKFNFEGTMCKINDWTLTFKEKKDSLKSALEYAKKAIDIQTYSIFVDIGVGNAALTGIACGAANALLGLICGFIGNILDINEKCETMVNPKFNKFVFDIGGNVVISFRVVKAVWLLFKLKELDLIPKNASDTGTML